MFEGQNIHSPKYSSNFRKQETGSKNGGQICLNSFAKRAKDCFEESRIPRIRAAPKNRDFSLTQRAKVREYWNFRHNPRNPQCSSILLLFTYGESRVTKFHKVCAFFGRSSKSLVIDLRIYCMLIVSYLTWSSELNFLHYESLEISHFKNIKNNFSDFARSDLRCVYLGPPKD